MSQAVTERHDVSEAETWDLTRIYADWNAWDAAAADIEGRLGELAAMQGRLGRSAVDFRLVIESIHSMREILSRVCVYASMRSDEDTRIGDHTARDGRAGTLAVAFSEALSWFEPEVLELDDATLATFLDEDPGLRLYEHLLDDVRRSRPHTLSPELEALLAAAGNVTRGAGQVFNALNNADLRFPTIQDENGDDIELTNGRYSKLVRSADRRVRRDAHENYMDAYGGVINTLAANLDANVKNHVFYARARRHESCLHASLHSNAVPAEVFHSLVDTVNAGLPSIHRYTALKKRILGVAELREYDLYVPLFTEGEFTLDYAESCDLMIEAFAPLGDEYVAAVRNGVVNRWIDVRENVGKRSGAYSSGAFGTDPYILLNWSDQLRDTFTLAHEMGHSMHSWSTCRYQPYVYSDYPIFTAEVASTFNEMLLMRLMIDGSDDPVRRLFLLDTLLDQINSTVFRQTMFAEVEHAVHRSGEAGETLTAESLDTLYLDTMKRYWGPEVEFDPDRSGRTWCRIPHFYYNFYVYQYATAFAASAALARRVLEGGRSEREDYLGFLRSGGSRYPVDTLRSAGIDVTTSRPVEDVFHLFESSMDEIETLLKELSWTRDR